MSTAVATETIRIQGEAARRIRFVASARSKHRIRYAMDVVCIQGSGLDTWALATDGRRAHGARVPFIDLEPGQYEVVKSLKTRVELRRVPDDERGTFPPIENVRTDPHDKSAWRTIAEPIDASEWDCGGLPIALHSLTGRAIQHKYTDELGDWEWNRIGFDAGKTGRPIELQSWSESSYYTTDHKKHTSPPQLEAFALLMPFSLRSLITTVPDRFAS